MDNGFFNGLFDFNKDGKLDPMEKAMDFIAFTDVMKKTQDAVNNSDKSIDDIKDPYK